MNTYTYFETDVPNILGGYCVYDSLERAIKAGARKIYLVTKVKSENNIGIKMPGYLCKELWRSLIWERKN